ncbi:hypothetical protein ACOSQ4_013385 [Xanthoceras sorbifolium]
MLMLCSNTVWFINIYHFLWSKSDSLSLSHSIWSNDLSLSLSIQLSSLFYYFPENVIISVEDRFVWLAVYVVFFVLNGIPFPKKKKEKKRKKKRELMSRLFDVSSSVHGLVFAPRSANRVDDCVAKFALSLLEELQNFIYCG